MSARAIRLGLAAGALAAATLAGTQLLAPKGNPHGLGASLTDSVDAPNVSEVYKAKGKKPTLDGAPTSYTIPGPLPPVLDQGSSGRCVAFSASAIRSYQEYRDIGAAKFLNFDEARFFFSIGGTDSAGALVSDSLAMQRSSGYPLVSVTSATPYRIASYASVPATQAAIMAALVDFQSPLQARSAWYRSWFYPVNGVLPRPDTFVAGHAWTVVGYNPTGILIQNSWGTDWGIGGRATMPWAYATKYGSFWTVTDLVTVKPSPTATPKPTASPTPKPTATLAPTAAPTAAPTPSPTVPPTAAPTPAPTASPTPLATPAPTVAPATPEPTVAPTPQPSEPAGGTLDKGRLALVLAALGVAAIVLAWSSRKED